MEAITHILPIIFGLSSFKCDNKKKLLILNILTCLSFVILFLFENAYAGAITCGIAAISSIIVLIYEKKLDFKSNFSLLIAGTLIVIYTNFTGEGKGLLDILPLFTFAIYRFGELFSDEFNYRICIMIGALSFIIYSLFTASYGGAIAESLWFFSCLFFILKKKEKPIEEKK